MTFLGRDGEQHHAYATSWGASTRLVGGLIMAHGDDKGLRLPPKVAPVQVVIVPIFRNDDEQARVLAGDRCVLPTNGARSGCGSRSTIATTCGPATSSPITSCAACPCAWRWARATSTPSR